MIIDEIFKSRILEKKKYFLHEKTVSMVQFQMLATQAFSFVLKKLKSKLEWFKDEPVEVAFHVNPIAYIQDDFSCVGTEHFLTILHRTE